MKATEEQSKMSSIDRLSESPLYRPNSISMLSKSQCSLGSSPGKAKELSPEQRELLAEQ